MFRIDSEGVDTASLETHNSRRDETLRSEPFRATVQYPQAVYEAGEFHQAAKGEYVAEGRLTLRGVTRALSVAFSFATGPGGTTAGVERSARVNRFDFGVRQGR